MRSPCLIAAVVLTAACVQPPPASPSASADKSTAPSANATAAPHPLDPLSTQEIEAAAKLIRAVPQFPGTGMFSTIVLKEPPKADVLAFKPGAPFARQVFAIVLD